MAVGNADMIKALFQIKANLDSGIPQAIQEMAIEALSGSQAPIQENNAIYQRRRDKLVEVLTGLGLGVTPPKACLYIWARVPQGHTSAGFAQHLLEDITVVVTPGSSYGKYGEGYIRLSLTTPDDQVDRGVERLKSWKIPAPER
jgi:LL-diaminopimelate aminotransferase